MLTEMDLRHLRREVRTALELAIISLAPSELTERLAASAGMLETVSELPTDAAPVAALLPKLAETAQKNLDDWQRWRTAYLEGRLPRG